MTCLPPGPLALVERGHPGPRVPPQLADGSLVASATAMEWATEVATEITTTMDIPDLEGASVLKPRGRHRLAEDAPNPWAARPKLLALVAVAVALVAAGLALLIPSSADRAGGQAGAGRQPDPQPGVPASGAPAREGALPPGDRTLAPAPVKLDVDGFAAWALIDRQGGIVGSDNLAATSWVGSVVKVWIVSDFLRRTAERGETPTPYHLELASRAIRDSEDPAAEELYRASGGTAQLRRMISICGLTDSSIDGSRWRSIRMSARDAARLGRCVTDGRAAGPSWTEWVRAEMAQVRGTVEEKDQPFGGRWGIVDGLPAELTGEKLGIKNGWVVGPGGRWQVNCLAMTDDWSLAVLLRYPAERGLRYGAEACADVATQLVTPPAVG